MCIGPSLLTCVFKCFVDPLMASAVVLAPRVSSPARLVAVSAHTPATYVFTSHPTLSTSISVNPAPRFAQ